MLGVGGAVGRVVHRSPTTRRFASTSSTTPCRAGARRVFTIVASLALIVLIALSLPATWHYVAFMKREHSAYLQMRFDFLYSIYVDSFAVVCIARQARVAWRAWHAPVPAATLTDRARTAPHDGPLAVRALRHRAGRAGVARAADRPVDDRRVDPLPARRRPRSGHRGRADPERPLQQLRAAGGAAVHPRGRSDEHRQPHRPAASSSASCSSDAFAAASGTSTSSPTSSSPACRARRSPTRSASAGSSSA